MTADLEKNYSDFVKMGWSPKVAAEAAYARAGVRTLCRMYGPPAAV